MIVRKYLIDNKTKPKKLVLALFSDIHFTNNFNINKLNKIKNNLLDNRPDYICIPGDIIDNTNILDNKDELDILLSFLKDIAIIAPVFICLGNHDISKMVKNKKVKSNNNNFELKLKSLIKNRVYLLNNDIYVDDNIRFIGLTLSYNYYYNKSNSEDPKVLINTFNKKIKLFDGNKLNIILCHSPINIFKEEVLSKLENNKNIDIILCGHMHNGMVPRFLERIFPKNRGIMAPDKSLYPDNARGIKEIKLNNNIIYGIVSGSITKIQKSALKILQIGNFFYKSQMEYIIVNSDKDKL